MYFLCVLGCIINITNSEFLRNSLTAQQSKWRHHGIGGGAVICLFDVYLTVHRTSFGQNLAAYGGAVQFWHCPKQSVFKTCTFTQNTAIAHGGAVQSDGDGVGPRFSDCVFSLNNATYGGAVYMRKTSVRIIRSTFTGNFAAFGGALCLNKDASAVVMDSVFRSNEARA